jgi:glycine/D-amino acid oxidase-like deaminating enzyme
MVAGLSSGEPYRRLSLWLDTVPGSLSPRPPLQRDVDVDVAIVGAGCTGLWTAYYLARLDPSLRIAMVEKEVAGFGASGRNGGWCSALFAASTAKVARVGGRDGAMALQRALFDTVDEVGRVTAAEGIDCHFAKGGTVVLARTPAQEARLRAEVAEEHSFGFGSADVRWLSAAESSTRVAAAGVLGGVYTPHCAALHPGRLVRGLATAVERLGVAIYERTSALRLGDRVVETPGGRVRAEVVVRATEGYTARLPGLRREIAPVYSLMIATEPLPPSFWSAVGWRERETLSDGRHLIIYAQRTADDRIAFGGRGAPYHFGSRVEPRFDREPRVFAELHRALVELFPAAGEAEITHRWGGPLGIPRDWFSSVGYDCAAGKAWAGGYVGDGVGTSNLAGRTLADLICARTTELVGLPWVGHRSPRWEPEPVRWLGANAGLRVMSLADAVENRTGRPSSVATGFSRFLGG